MQLIGSFLIALICCTTIVNISVADITRGCAARWEIRQPSTGQVRDFSLFDSRGRCRSRIYANDCRSAARQYAQDCFRSHWNKRWNPDVTSGRVKPPDCVGRGDIGVKDYNLANLKAEIERQACRLAATRPFSVLVIGRTTGDTGCGGEITVSEYWIEDEMCGN